MGKYSDHSTYINKKEVEVPSVTTIIKLLNKPFIAKWANSLGWKRQSYDKVLEEQKEIKKAGQQALDKARRQVGAKKELIKISDLEWEAIQAGAISPNKLQQILNNCDLDVVRQKATPKVTNSLSQSKINHIATLKKSGYTNEQIANKLGVSVSTIIKHMKGDK